MSVDDKRILTIIEIFRFVQPKVLPNDLVEVHGFGRHFVSCLS